jgi:2-keto-4-pentenoate hydratase
MSAAAERIAELFSDAWSNHRQIELDTLSAPQSVDEAYAVQDRVFAARYPSQRIAAWKAGASGADAEPSAAPIGEVRASPAVLAAGAFHMFGIEAEIAFRIGRDLHGSGGWSEKDLADAVGEILVTIEVCDTRLANWKTASPLWRLADFQLNGALVVGSGLKDWQKVDFAAQAVELWVNGRKTANRTGSHPLGTPVAVLPWIVEHCARRSGGLRAGDLVTTGSWTGMEFVAPGDTVLARFPGIGEASVRIA